MAAILTGKLNARFEASVRDDYTDLRGRAAVSGSALWGLDDDFDIVNAI